MAEIEALAMRLDIETALRLLPPAHGRAMMLFYLDGQGIAQIAARAEQPEGTIKSWLHHGRKNLAHILQEYVPMTTVKDHPDLNTPTLDFSDQRTVILWQKFTERARRAVLQAEEEAKRFRGNFVTSEHLLMGLRRCLTAWAQDFFQSRTTLTCRICGKR